jgi:hypothetical protein
MVHRRGEPMDDIINSLLKHHEEIRQLFEKTDHDKRRFGELKKNLEVHHTNEEAYLLREIMDKAEVGEPAAEACEEHYIITFMLGDLDNFPRESKRWVVKYEVLQEFTEHHLQEEEEHIFRYVHGVLDKKELEELGRQYETVKRRQLEAL